MMLNMNMYWKFNLIQVKCNKLITVQVVDEMIEEQQKTITVEGIATTA